jgi:outer membrane lipoprotein-sorting protein
MKKIATGFTAIIILFIGLSGFTTQDQKAAKILNDVSKTYKSYKTIKAKFSLSITSKNSKKPMVQKGTLYLKGKKFRIDMDGQKIFCDGKKMWTYFSDGSNEVQITKYDPKAQDINPSEIFTIYKKGFMYRYSGEVVRNGKKIQKIELTPEDKSKPFFKVKLSIDKLAHKITDMTVYSKNGTHTNYVINSFSPNVSISDKFFKFNEKDYPGVIVIDLTK